MHKRESIELENWKVQEFTWLQASLSVHLSVFSLLKAYLSHVFVFILSLCSWGRWLNSSMQHGYFLGLQERLFFPATLYYVSEKPLIGLDLGHVSIFEPITKSRGIELWLATLKPHVHPLNHGGLNPGSSTETKCKLWVRGMILKANEKMVGRGVDCEPMQTILIYKWT